MSAAILADLKKLEGCRAAIGGTAEIGDMYARYCMQFVHDHADAIAALTREAPPEALPAIPDILFDGYAVYSELDADTKRRTSSENVSDVLDAVVSLMRKATPPAPQRQSSNPSGLSSESVSLSSDQRMAQWEYDPLPEWTAKVRELWLGVPIEEVEQARDAWFAKDTQPPRQDRGDAPSIRSMPFVTIEQVNAYRAESLRVEAQRDELLAALTEAKQQDGPLSSRLRAGVECAPWVIEEVRKLEAKQQGPGEAVAWQQLYGGRWEERSEDQYRYMVRQNAERPGAFTVRALGVIAPQVEAKRQTGEGVFLPLHPTAKMTIAMHDAYKGGHSMVEVYAAMIAAAAKPSGKELP